MDHNEPHVSDADRIRQYVFEQFIAPARQRGERYVIVKVRDVHDALALNQAWANICQAIAGAKFHTLAQVGPPDIQGAKASPASAFKFDLQPTEFSVAAVEREFNRRYGEPIRSNQKMFACALPDRRQIAVNREISAAEIWVEATTEVPARFQSRLYSPDQGRHSNLPARLNHQPPAGERPRRVAMVRVGSWPELTDLLDWYESCLGGINRERLEEYKRQFLARFPDFEPAGFASDGGSYFTTERAYKNVLINSASAVIALQSDKGDAEIGDRILKILMGESGAESNLLGWRLVSDLRAIRAKHPGLMEEAAGRLARAGDVVLAISEFVSSTWSVLSEGKPSKPYSTTRSLPTMIAGLVHPETAYAINTDPVSKIAQSLTGKPIFSNDILKPTEYSEVLALMKRINAIMADEWGWAPRDLWDVQGFVWTVAKIEPTDGKPAENIGTDSMTVNPTNLILYGPPGTGKTYATSLEAVRLCKGSAPHDRKALMAEYAQLVASGRIEFITFHQSYSYEEFIEGLRPTPIGEGQAGFRLEPEMGAFRRIARRAEASKGTGSDLLSIGNRQVFKMSIGEAANPDDAYLFEEAMQGGYTLLGFSDIDWSDDRFKDREAIIEACKAAPAPGEQEPNAMSGRVQCPYIFRNWLKVGDIIVVSKGNLLFRAIGLVTGEYEYAPRESGEYSHRRAVTWLWRDEKGVPVEDIYAKSFSQKSIYLLNKSDLNIPALERYIAGPNLGTEGEPEQFVLIIDEINRANISKVFGELISLIEPDKRLGAINELQVRLPYSREYFGVPKNLHIVGTMNTADRSIALLDTALRRRFEFRELMPDPERLAEISAKVGINLVKMLSVINERIEYLFDREHQIGHAYFMTCAFREDVDELMLRKVIPLLAEYFFEDWAKVATVLGDGAGESNFIERITLTPPNGLDMEGGEPRYRWRVLSPFKTSCYDQFT